MQPFSAAMISPSIIPESAREAEHTAAIERSGERIVLTVAVFSETSTVMPTSPSAVATGQFGFIPSDLPLSMVKDLKGSFVVYPITSQGTLRT